MRLVDFKDNALAQDAIHIISETDKNVFLTGNAGTGKSTLLRQIIETTTKKTIVLAPTGVAALNVGGITIHSFFQLVPKIIFSKDIDIPYNFKSEKIELFRALELLVIDEVSMLRADTVDYFDSILKRYRKNDLPFGGVQLMLVGDLNQLPPIVDNKDRHTFNNLYPGPFFFQSNAFQNTELLTIKLEKSYRQQDQIFINLLDKIRENNISIADLDLINERVAIPFVDDSIILTTTNKDARDTNSERLSNLNSPCQIFTAKFEGDVKEIESCAERQLHLKIGAKVIFLNNDYYKRWVNGSMGKVVGFENNKIQVILDGEDLVEVAEYTWENIEYRIDKKTKKLCSSYKGEITQFPLKLAWAITIHKSQGLTFNKVVIDLGRGSWQSGQTYVALSRCRSLHGIFLKKTIKKNDIMLDNEVSQFSRRFNNESVFRTSEIAKSIRRLRLSNNAPIDSSKVEEILKNTSERYHIASNVKEKFEFLARLIYCEYLLNNLQTVDQLMNEIKKYKVLSKIFGHNIFKLLDDAFCINRNNNLDFNQIKQLSKSQYFIENELFDKIFFPNSK